MGVVGRHLDEVGFGRLDQALGGGLAHSYDSAKNTEPLESNDDEPSLTQHAAPFRQPTRPVWDLQGIRIAGLIVGRISRDAS